MKRLWESSGVRFVREMAEVYFDRRVSRSAAELAYFLVLSFFPALICVNAFVGLLRLDVDLVLTAAGEFLPREVLPILGEYLGYVSTNQSNAMLAAGLTMVLFSASAAFRALMNIMADIYRRPTYQGVGQVVASVLFSILFLVTIYLSMVVLLTGSWFLHLVEGWFPWVAQLVGSWQSARFPILFCLVLLFVLLAYRLSAPGLGKEVGATLGLNQSFFQGFFLSPTVVAGALKGAVFAANIYESLGFDVVPNSTESRHDIIQAVTFGKPEAVIAFCKGIQAAAPVDSFVTPEPWDMPGYDAPVIMAAGAFVQGSSIELSADGPIKPPYAVYFQGGLTWYHAKLGILMSLQKLLDAGLVTL